MKLISSKKTKRFTILLLVAVAVSLYYWRRQSNIRVESSRRGSSALSRPLATSNLTSRVGNQRSAKATTLGIDPPSPLASKRGDRKRERNVGTQTRAGDGKGTRCRHANLHASKGVYSHVASNATKCSEILALKKIPSKPNMENTWTCPELKNTDERACLVYAYGVPSVKPFVEELKGKLGCKVFASEATLLGSDLHVALFNAGFADKKKFKERVDPYMKLIGKLGISDIITEIQKEAGMGSKETLENVSNYITVLSYWSVTLQTSSWRDERQLKNAHYTLDEQIKMKEYVI
ncbi:uncharacterized protein LOC122246623 [Penaeus japonicus]|uniref:uncharacterized protein LOC122246623 n=1 Tax=Penaeus japonicus TaxID=27405 RepID=UPI001C716029|nr:uncharacterized protein LOC122246623 [Penaeus japonicus]